MENNSGFKEILVDKSRDQKKIPTFGPGEIMANNFPFDFTIQSPAREKIRLVAGDFETNDAYLSVLFSKAAWMTHKKYLNIPINSATILDVKLNIAELIGDYVKDNGEDYLLKSYNIEAEVSFTGRIVATLYRIDSLGVQSAIRQALV